MELRRKYRNDPSISNTKLKLISFIRRLKKDKSEPEVNFILKRNGWLRRNFSLTGVYYHLSRYGEDLLRPILVGIAIVIVTMMFFVTQSDPNLPPTLPYSLLERSDSITNTVYTIQQEFTSVNTTTTSNGNNGT